MSSQRIFISYARKDGAELAQRLLEDLKKQGLDPWLDTRRIRGGASWTREIETALDESDVVLALLTQGSYLSEICRAEQLHSLRKGKTVIPLLVKKGSEIPLHLESKNYLDFTGDSYPQRFKQLLEDIAQQKGIELKEQYRQTYVTAPPLPVNFVERSEELQALRNVLMGEGTGRHIAVTAFRGMGGIGKTVLTQALCHDEVIQQAFPDGVVWITIGKENTVKLVDQMREVGRALKDDDLSKVDNELAATNQYRNTIRNKAALVVLDDVWNATAINPFRAEAARSRLLFTTRDAGIAAAVGAQEHRAELLTEEQSRTVLARWSGKQEDKLPRESESLIKECGRLPLALSMIGAMLRNKPVASWQRVLDLLRNADLEKIKTQFPDYPYTDLLRAIQVSVDSLDEQIKERYLALAVLMEDMPAAPIVQQTLWGVDKAEAADTSSQLVGLSLAQPDGDGSALRLHDLQLDYVRAQFPDREALNLIHGAVRLSSYVIMVDPAQFASQMVGRLLAHMDITAIHTFASRLESGAPRPWLRPLRPTLHPPGTALIRTLHGHSGGVSGVALSTDGRRAISASFDNTLKLWDVDSGRELRTLKGHTVVVMGVALSADGRRAVSTSIDKTLKLWDVDSGRELRTFEGHSDWVRGVALSIDGSRVISASADTTLKLWDVDSGHELRTFEGHSAAVTGVALSADGRRAISASDDNTLKLWDVDTGPELRTLQGHVAPVMGVALSTDGSYAISASSDKTLKLWDVDSGRELRTFEGHSDSVTGVALSADGRRAISASRDNTLKLWDMDTGCELRTLYGHSDWIRGVALSTDGSYAISASDDKTLKLWDVDSGRELRTFQYHSSWVRNVALSADGRRAISASDDQTLKLWDVDTGRELRTFHGHSDWVRDVALSADGRRAISASDDQTLKLWDVDSGRELRTFQGHSGSVRGVALSADGRRAISASSNHGLKLWDVDSGRELRTLTGYYGSVTSVALSTDASRAISASSDHTLELWDVDSGRKLHTLMGHYGPVTSVALSADASRAISASYDNTLKLWDVDSGRELRTLEGHSDSVTSVALSADGRRALSASNDTTLKLWNVYGGRVLATFTCDSAASCCAFIGDVIIGGDIGGRIYFLRLEE